MAGKRAFIIRIFVPLCLVLLTSCSSSPPTSTATPTPTHVVNRPTPVLSPSPTSTPNKTPTHYTEKVLYSGRLRPDDMAFDKQGNILFSDFYHGTISRINSDGSVSLVISGIAGPEGIVVLSDGTMIIAEQRTNRILVLAPGSKSLSVLRVLPGVPSGASCKDGVDGIAFDPFNKTLIIPDSPTGAVYSLSLDGNTMKLLNSNIVRPVGAAVDSQGNIYVADECGGAVDRITPDGKMTKLGGFGMPDDVAFDSAGNMLVTDLKTTIHALVRVLNGSGKHQTLASKGFIEPQGLLVDKNDNIYVSDDYADKIVEFLPA